MTAGKLAECNVKFYYCLPQECALYSHIFISIRYFTRSYHWKCH